MLNQLNWGGDFRNYYSFVTHNAHPVHDRLDDSRNYAGQMIVFDKTPCVLITDKKRLGFKTLKRVEEITKKSYLKPKQVKITKKNEIIIEH